MLFITKVDAIVICVTIVMLRICFLVKAIAKSFLNR